jgi:hypothetical protein
MEIRLILFDNNKTIQKIHEVHFAKTKKDKIGGYFNSAITQMIDNVIEDDGFIEIRIIK